MMRTVHTCGAVLLCALAFTACSSRSAGVGIQAGVVGGGDAVEEGDKVWVCHQGRWQEVGAPAGDAHRRHGDAVSVRPRDAGSSC